ncbi:probable pectate lyase 5 [Salvia hispanica]|uniref:probable pectate lyase 5 n=1 Tax=Salvia hispanica TaxID=49212 RepID=UPI00200953F1|nr:probable pectate lyase 5 [Salvia hispanica]
MVFPDHTYIILLLLLLRLVLPFSVGATTFFNLTLSHHHPNPDFVALQVTRSVNESISKRRPILETPLSKAQSQCLTGNPIDDCWRCDPNWGNNRQRLADCAIGFGQGAMGGKGGRFYVVTDSSDHDTVSPTPGTLRYAVIQEEPLWIIFNSNMVIKLKHELIFNSHKTIDGRGANVQITGNGCLTLQYVSNIIIHNVRVYNCMLSGNTNIRSSTTHFGHRGVSDGDGITIFGSRNIWIDHCTLSHCTDGLVDITVGSTAITVSNNYLSDHDKAMLLGHDDKFLPDSGMQVTIAFNRFGKGLVQRLPRVRRGYIHVVNNDYYKWKMYAIGGSANPTVNSEGNRFTASDDHNVKEVTKHEDASEGEWANWNWRSNGDLMLNGAFFVPSGDGAKPQYAKASSFDPISVNQIDQLTMNAGVLGGTRDTGVSYGGGSITFTGAAQRESSLPSNLFLSSLIILILYISSTIAGGFL